MTEMISKDTAQVNREGIHGLETEEKKVFFKIVNALYELSELEPDKECANWPYVIYISELLSNYLWCRINGINPNHSFDGFSGLPRQTNKFIS